MPYIKREEREKFKEVLKLTPETPGELAYLIWVIINNFLNINKPKYKNFVEVIGVLHATILELYRRQIAPYEDLKIEQNGDI